MRPWGSRGSLPERPVTACENDHHPQTVETIVRSPASSSVARACSTDGGVGSRSAHVASQMRVSSLSTVSSSSLRREEPRTRVLSCGTTTSGSKSIGAFGVVREEEPRRAHMPDQALREQS